MVNKHELTDLEWQIKTRLEGRRGREMAISRVKFCEPFAEQGVSERTVRATIKHLIVKHKCPIGSCPGGYFWAVTPEEIEAVCNYFKGYALSQLQVISNLKGEPLSRILGQMTFSVIGEETGQTYLRHLTDARPDTLRLKHER